MIVIDANILVDFLIPGEESAAAEKVFSRDPDWIAPPLLRSEFRNVLATLIRRRVIAIDAALLVMEEAERLLEGNEFPVNSVEVLTLSGRSACSAYDCEYVALSQMLRIPLVTWDREILAAFPKNSIDPDKFTRA